MDGFDRWMHNRPDIAGMHRRGVDTQPGATNSACRARGIGNSFDGELHASRIELTFWHTFPHMTLDVDSLVVISHSLRNLPDSIQVPEGADTLLTVESLHGGINLLPLTVGHIALHDVLIHKPQANLVEVTPGKANYMIFSTDDSEENDGIVAAYDTGCVAAPFRHNRCRTSALSLVARLARHSA